MLTYYLNKIIIDNRYSVANDIQRNVLIFTTLHSTSVTHRISYNHTNCVIIIYTVYKNTNEHASSAIRTRTPVRVFKFAEHQHTTKVPLSAFPNRSPPHSQQEPAPAHPGGLERPNRLLTANMCVCVCVCVRVRVCVRVCCVCACFQFGVTWTHRHACLVKWGIMK